MQLSGGTFYDGGVADPIPIVRSLHDGNRKNLIVLTQPKSNRKALTRGLKFAAHALHRKYPAMTETMLARPGLYNDTVCLCRRLAEENPADMVLLQPDAPLATFEKDIKKLEWGYEEMTLMEPDSVEGRFFVRVKDTSLDEVDKAFGKVEAVIEPDSLPEEFGFITRLMTQGE